MNVSLTAYRGAEEPWRFSRLLRVYERLVQLLGWEKAAIIVELVDHKGTLSVFYERSADAVMRHIVNEAWEAENESLVEHQEI